MGVNKVIMNTSGGGQTIIDLTEDTVTPQTLAEGITAHNAAGEVITGVMSTTSGGSGGNVDTCTITFEDISGGDCAISFITALVYENGNYNIYTYFLSNEFLNTMTVPNVVCGSAISLGSNLYSLPPYVEIDGSAVLQSIGSMSRVATNLYLFSFTAPQTANEHCTIYYAYEP